MSSTQLNKKEEISTKIFIERKVLGIETPKGLALPVLSEGKSYKWFIAIVIVFLTLFVLYRLFRP